MIYKKLFIDPLGTNHFHMCSLQQFPRSSFRYFGNNDYLASFRNYRLVNNTPKEITDVVVEMYLKSDFCIK